MENSSVRAHLFIRGRVQGVGYRAFVQAQAVKRDLTGWVRNLADGGVESEAEGNRRAVEGFIEALKAGPYLSRVEHVDLQWVESTGQDSFFRIVM
ncbi:MAG: acylphosphatase [Nitrospinae bacterium]|nr:acylphosphatase [Nitrospinota bacterium]MEC4670816.1 acylphosphatase [Nitrospirota bacterium]